jgi:hypothetical protein
MAINYYNNIIVGITDNNKLFSNDTGKIFVQITSANTINFKDITWGTKGFFICGIDTNNNKNNNILYSFNGFNWYNINNLQTINAITGFTNIYSGYNQSNRNIILAVGTDGNLYYSNNYYNWNLTNLNNNDDYDGSGILKIISGKNYFLLLTSQNNLFVSKDGIKWQASVFNQVSLLYYYNNNFYIYGKYMRLSNLSDNTGISTDISTDISTGISTGMPLTLYTSTDGIVWKYIENYTPLPDVDNFYDLTIYVPKAPINISNKIDYININTTSGQLNPDIMKNIVIYNEFNEIIMPGDFQLFQIFCDSIRVYKVEINLPVGYNYKNMFLTFLSSHHYLHNLKIILFLNYKHLFYY